MKIILIGASTRPLIASCIASGATPVAFDLFADWDAQQMVDQCGLPGAGLTKIKCYADLLQHDLSSAGDAVMFSGGAELLSDLVDRFAKSMEILGTKAESLLAIRDHLNWLGFLKKQGFNVPSSLRTIAGLTESVGEVGEGWLRKRIGTCGGSGVVNVESSKKTDLLEDDYFQKVVAGRSCSAQLVSASNAGSCLLLGCCRQMFYLRTPFEYAGSFTSNEFPAIAKEQVQEIGWALSRKFSLNGFWGFDFILDDANCVWPVDLNVRPTASTELFENLVRTRMNLKSCIDLQRISCRGDVFTLDDVSAKTPVEGKLVLFNQSEKPILINRECFRRLSEKCDLAFDSLGRCGISLADIPNLGQKIEPGSPVLTVRVRAEDNAALLSMLRRAVATVQSILDIGLMDLDWDAY